MNGAENAESVQCGEGRIAKTVLPSNAIMTKMTVKKEKEIANFFVKYFITEHGIDRNSTIPFKEEIILINEAQKGNKKSLEKIINAYRWLISETCLIYRNYYPENDSDVLTAKALISFNKSIRSYKLNASYRFSVYAMEGIAINFGIDMDLAELSRKD